MHTDADVVVVGYGPVGQTLAILLAQRGRRTIVVERWPRPYAMPRAVAFDSESARILAAAGLADFVHEFSEPSGEYRWLDASGRTLLSIEASEQGRCGWPDSLSMYQPGLEAALAARAARLPTLDVRRGFEAVAVTETPDGVELTVRESGGTAERVLTAGWVVGCDGANSFVRAALGAPSTDLDFSHDWLICDVVPAGPAEFRPNNLQICDPVRPTTHVSAGPGHRRWEFMRVAGRWPSVPRGTPRSCTGRPCSSRASSSSTTTRPPRTSRRPTGGWTRGRRCWTRCPAAPTSTSSAAGCRVGGTATTARTTGS